jgi:hypothetical protein
MKKIIFFLLIISLKSTAQTVVPSEIINDTFLIFYEGKSGTCFRISIDSNDYFITAKHLFDYTDTPNEHRDSLLFNKHVEFAINVNNRWVKYNATLLIDKNPNIDIAVLDLNAYKQKRNLFDIGFVDCKLTQEYFFIGFPLDVKEGKDAEIHKPLPLQIIKRGIISAFQSDSVNGNRIYLDGFCNHGFSGAPVFVRNIKNKSNHRFSIIGVIRGAVEEDKVAKTPSGNFNYKEDMGISQCVDISYVYEIIKRKSSNIKK